MTVTNPPQVDKTISALRGILRSDLIKIGVMAFAVFIGVFLLGTLVGSLRGLTLSQFLATAGAVLVIVLVAVAAASHLAKLSIIDHLNETLTGRLADLGGLIETCKELKEMMKEGRAWLLDDEAVLALEQETDDEVLVIAPDLHYEFQPRYRDVVLANLLRPGGPRYRYVVFSDGQAETDRGDLLKALEQQLASRGIVDAAPVLGQRFQVILLPQGQYPDSVLYGLAIYVKKTGEVRCLQYLPREFGTMNIEVPCTGDLGRRLVARTRAHFERLATVK